MRSMSPKSRLPASDVTAEDLSDRSLLDEYADLREVALLQLDEIADGDHVHAANFNIRYIRTLMSLINAQHAMES